MAHLQGREQQAKRKKRKPLMWRTPWIRCGGHGVTTRSVLGMKISMTSNAVEFCIAYVYDIHEWINFVGMLAAVVRQWTHTTWKMSMDVWHDVGQVWRWWDDEWRSHIHWHPLLGTWYSIKANGFIGKTNTCSKQLWTEIACECHHQSKTHNVGTCI